MHDFWHISKFKQAIMHTNIISILQNVPWFQRNKIAKVEVTQRRRKAATTAIHCLKIVINTHSRMRERFVTCVVYINIILTSVHGTVHYRTLDQLALIDIVQ